MKYSKDDIHFEEITPRGFENLCYDLIVKYGFSEVTWRDGGADNGRDIEAHYTFANPIKRKDLKYFFECKHYTSGGVPPEHLNSKVAWADAEVPSFLVLILNSYLTVGARTWLEKISGQKAYDIICIEREQLKERLINYPEIIERYFSQGRYEQLFKDIKDYKAKFNINPSYELLQEIAKKIDLAKLNEEDFGFILLNFYGQFELFETRNHYFDDFEESTVYRILDFLKDTISNELLDSFNPYKDDYYQLDGNGIFDDMIDLEFIDEDTEISKLNFLSYLLHLNSKQSNDKWKLGEYLFVIYKDIAFEIFKQEKTQIRIIKDFTPDRLADLSLGLGRTMIVKYKEYLQYFKD